MLQLEYIKQAIQWASYKELSSDQEWNSIDSSRVNKSNVGSLCIILGYVISPWVDNDTTNET